MALSYLTKDKTKVGKQISAFPRTQSQMAQYQRDYLMYSGKWYEKATQTTTPAPTAPVAPINGAIPAGMREGDVRFINGKNMTLTPEGTLKEAITPATHDHKPPTAGITSATAPVVPATPAPKFRDTRINSQTGQKEIFGQQGNWEALYPVDETGQTVKPPVDPVVKDIPPVVPSEDLTDGTKGTPDVADPQADIITTTYITGLVDDLAKKRKSLDDLYKKQLSDLDAKKKDYEKKISDIEAKQEGIITDDIKPLLDPFRADLEKSERERLKIEKNFFANQKSIEELETLLTQAQAEIETAKEKTGLASIRSPRIAKIREDMAGRVGIIEAVMAVRNNQISVAENMIDRSINAMTADRNDQLNYFNTLYNFYETQRDEEGNKLFALEADEKDIINSQISLLENDMAQSQATADYIKGMMLDPATADIMEQSGVKLNDTIDVIQQKLSDYTYKQETIDIDNNMEEQGYEHLVLADQIAGKPENELIRQTDSRGIERVYWKEAEVEAEDPTIQNISFSVDDKEYSGMGGLQDYLKDNPNTSYEDMRLELAKMYPDMKLKDIESALEVAGYEETKTGGTGGDEIDSNYIKTEIQAQHEAGATYEQLVELLTRPESDGGMGLSKTRATTYLAGEKIKTTEEVEKEEEEVKQKKEDKEQAYLDIKVSVDKYMKDWANAEMGKNAKGKKDKSIDKGTGDDMWGTRESFGKELMSKFPEFTYDEIMAEIYKKIDNEWLDKNRHKGWW